MVVVELGMTSLGHESIQHTTSPLPQCWNGPKGAHWLGAPILCPWVGSATEFSPVSSMAPWATLLPTLSRSGRRQLQATPQATSQELLESTGFLVEGHFQLVQAQGIQASLFCTSFERMPYSAYGQVQSDPVKPGPEHLIE